MQQLPPQHDILREIKRPLRLFLTKPPNRRLLLGEWQVLQVDDGERDGRIGRNHLLRLPVNFLVDRPQHRMTTHNFVQCLRQVGNIERSLYLQDDRQIVNSTTIQLIQKPKPLLVERQWKARFHRGFVCKQLRQQRTLFFG